ncbi:MAG: hypothetical protein NWP98_03660, partial [Erythrobacter sp.]|nr:hypothetical protein [Erythrobacter sp.]
LNANDWYVRHARRLLQERGANAATTAALEKILFENPDDTRQLRALWTLHAQGALTEATLLRTLEAKSAAVRGWAITCATEGGKPSRSWLRTKANSIEGGTSEVMLNVISKRILDLPGA